LDKLLFGASASSKGKQLLKIMMINWYILVGQEILSSTQSTTGKTQSDEEDLWSLLNDDKSVDSTGRTVSTQPEGNV